MPTLSFWSPVADDWQCEYTLLHHLVTLPFEVFTPSAIAAGIEVWTWVIAEKPGAEVVLISEILAAWFATVRDRKGVFSRCLKSGLSTGSYYNSWNFSRPPQLRRSILSPNKIQPHRQRGNRSCNHSCPTSSSATYPCPANVIQSVASCSLPSVNSYISYATACLTVRPRP